MDFCRRMHHSYGIDPPSARPFMSDNVTAERIETIAAAAGVPLEPGAAARIAHAVSPTIARFTAGPVAMPFETEPSTFVVVQRTELGR
jgi:hypothetical protein